MTMYPKSNGAWTVWTEALLFRERARRTAMSEDEFGPLETELYELENAGITGEDNPRTYEVEYYSDDRREAPTDYRDIDPRFD